MDAAETRGRVVETELCKVESVAAVAAAIRFAKTETEAGDGILDWFGFDDSDTLCDLSTANDDDGDQKDEIGTDADSIVGVVGVTFAEDDNDNGNDENDDECADGQSKFSGLLEAIDAKEDGAENKSDGLEETFSSLIEVAGIGKSIDGAAS